MKRCALLLLFAIVSLVACQEKVDPERAALEKDIAALKDIYYNGAFFSTGSVLNDVATVSFSDGTVVSFKKEDFRIYDCTETNLPVIDISYPRNEWTYNQLLSGVEVNKSLSDEDAVPFCAAFDRHFFYLYLNNGSKFMVSDRSEGALTMFCFSKKNNPDLPFDFTCDIDSTAVTGRLPEGVTTYSLTPDFTYRGRSIKVRGQEQQSGKVKHNFEEVVEYEVEGFDGSVVTYRVRLTAGNSFPAVYIDTKGAPIRDKFNYVPSTIRFEDRDLKYSDVRAVEFPMHIKGRGNSTWTNFPKKPYHIKLDEKAKVFGMRKNRDWYLMANYADKSLLRNKVAMKLSEICEFPFTFHMYSVDVYLNNKYIGVYDLCESKEVCNDRVNISEDSYYLEIDEAMGEAKGWWTGMQVPIVFQQPEYPTGIQYSYIQKYFSDFEQTLKSSFPSDPVKGYPAYIDIKTFVDFYIVQELTKNIDGNLRRSSFLTLEPGGKLTFYHVWDFDLVLGNCDFMQSMYGASNTATGWFIKDYGCQGYGYGWYYLLMRDHYFIRKVQERWKEIYPKLLEVPDYIEEQREYMRAAADRNFKEWPILNTYVWPNYYPKGTYDQHVDFMKKFYTDRLYWLNAELNKL